MRIAITGATGNIGTATLRRLGATGVHRLTGIARRVPTDSRVVTWRSADLTTDACLPVLLEAFDSADAVVHLAWGFQPSHDADHLAELGIGGTRRVLQSAAAAGVPHLVHISSIGAYSPRRDDVPVDESWPVGGVPSAQYSRHKATAEQVLDDHEAVSGAPLVTRVRPALVGQRAAGSELLRYTVPAIVPAWALCVVPLLPLDRSLRVQMVHADDVADAIVRILDRLPGGAFNLAAEPVLTADVIAGVLGARPVHLPSRVLRALVETSWRLRLQQVDTGWIDMAYALPLLDPARAHTELGWSPSRDAVSVLREVVDGMRERAYGQTAVMRRRTVPGAFLDAVRRGPVGVRDQP